MVVFGFLNDDIMIDVLSRLPTKTLLGLKCVSKGWHDLISDRAFIRFQLKKTEPLSGFFFQERFQWCNEDIKTLSYVPAGMEDAKVQFRVFDFLHEDVVILGSSNGLICCRSCFPSPHPVIYICNPSNKEWVSLKWPAPNKQDSLALAFDPFQNPVDISTKFKVVRVCQTETDMDDSYFSFEIYSSESGAWRKSKEICQCNHNLFKNKGIFIAGVLHWLTDGDEILTFDVENELAYLISVPFPATQFHSIPETCIGGSEGRLHYVMISEDGLQVWSLENYFELEWALKFSVSLEEMEKENLQFLYNIPQRVGERVTLDRIPWMDPLAFKDELLFMRVAAKIYLYHTEARKMEELCSLSQLGLNSMVAPTVIPYSMSLVPLS